MVLALLALQLSIVSTPMEPVPVILDTDIGGDIDDTWALAMLLGSPQIDLKMIVTACDDTESKARLVAKMLERAGRTDIVVAVGEKTSDRPLNQAAWLGDYTLDRYPGKVLPNGAQALVDAVNTAPIPVTLLVIGPQMNIRAALELDPGIARKARVVTMAGSIYVGYQGQPGRAAEYNVKRDVAAARAVFGAPWEIVVTPLDTCGNLRLSGDQYREVEASTHPLARIVIENYDAWAHRESQPADSSSILFDTVAAYLTFDQSLCEMETVKLVVNESGETVPDGNGTPAACALRWKDEETFKRLLVDAVTGNAAK